MVRLSTLGVLVSTSWASYVLASPAIEIGLKSSFAAAPYLLELLYELSFLAATRY